MSRSTAGCSAAHDPALMDVVILAWAYPPEESGLSRAAREIAQALADAGHAVRVLTLDRPWRSQDRDGAVTVIGCAPRAGGRRDRLRGLPGLGHLVAPFLFHRALRAAYRDRRFDVVEGTNWYAPGLFAALFGPAPYVTRHSTPVSTSGRPPAGLRDRIDLLFAASLERRAARAAAGSISNTAPHGARIARLYGLPPPGPGHAVIGLSLPPVIVARGTAAHYPPDRAPIALLFVGRAERRKGFDALMAALPMLAADADAGHMPQFHVTLIGIAPGDVATLPAAVRGRLCCLPRVEDDALHAHLAACHVVVAPSRYESFGLVYQEAMMFGRPVLGCAEDPSARLFVGETGAGLLADRCDGPALAAALGRLIRDGDLRQRLHLASRAAAGRFTRATLARETIAAYQQAMTGPS